MRMAQKLIAALLTVLLCVGMLVPAMGEGAQYSTTRNFLELLDEEKLSYNYAGTISNGDEHVFMENEDENFAYTFNIYFHPDNDRVCAYVWNIITFEDADFARVLRVVNELNYTYKYTRFYVDETDNTVTCALTLILHDDNDAGDIVLEGLLRMASILKKAYPMLAVYGK